MPRVEIDLKPCDLITSDAIGKPGKRVFYLQGKQGEQVVTLLVEKIQIQTMALGVEEFLAEITKRFPDLVVSSDDYEENDMHITPPVDPLFRVGELGLAYDADSDLIILVARELLAENTDPEEMGVVRFWCTRSQIRALSQWALIISGRGRPTCPYCGEPMEAEGHFCPKKNGHKH